MIVSTDIRRHMENVAGFLHRRHKVRPLHTVEEMEFIAAAFPENIRIWEVWREDRLVGASMAFLMPHIIRPQHLFISEDAAAIGGASVLVWNPAGDGWNSGPLVGFRHQHGSRNRRS